VKEKKGVPNVPHFVDFYKCTMQRSSVPPLSRLRCSRPAASECSREALVRIRLTVKLDRVSLIPKYHNKVGITIFVVTPSIQNPDERDKFTKYFRISNERAAWGSGIRDEIMDSPNRNLDVSF